MKRISKLIGIVLLLSTMLVCLAGCRFNNNELKESNLEEINEDGDTVYTKDFGSYVVSDGWMESKTHSAKGKYFYVKSGEDDESKPNNISINEGSNKYKKEEHEAFKNAIYSQLVRQTSSQSEEITAYGSKTNNGDILYTFVIRSKQSIVKQYYIVGNKKYIMVHETVWNTNDEEVVDKVAKKMVNSFEWND